MTSKFIFTVLLMSLPLFNFAQKLHFDVTLFGDSIGHTEVEKKDSSGFTVYYLKSQSNAKVLFVTRKSLIFARLVKRNDELLKSTYFHKNEEESFTAYTLKEIAGFSFTKNGIKKYLTKHIKSCAIELYFKEPEKLTDIYSERLGTFFDLTKIAEHIYKFVGEHGATSTYNYRNGVLQELELRKGQLGAVFLKRRL